MTAASSANNSHSELLAHLEHARLATWLLFRRCATGEVDAPSAAQGVYDELEDLAKAVESANFKPFADVLSDVAKLTLLWRRTLERPYVPSKISVRPERNSSPSTPDVGSQSGLKLRDADTLERIGALRKACRAIESEVATLRGDAERLGLDDIVGSSNDVARTLESWRKTLESTPRYLKLQSWIDRSCALLSHHVTQPPSDELGSRLRTLRLEVQIATQSAELTRTRRLTRPKAAGEEYARSKYAVVALDGPQGELAGVFRELQQNGVRVTHSRDLVTFLASLASVEPSFIFVSSGVSEISAAELCAKLRERSDTARIPLIVWSELPESDVDIYTQQVGAHACLSPHSSVDDILAMLDQLHVLARSK